MNIRTLILILTFAVCSIAVADMITIEEGIESSTSDIRLPGQSNGYLVLRSCSECDEITLSLSAGTQYLVNGELIEYEDFLHLSRATGNGLDIFYDPESNAVTRMMLQGNFSDE